MKHIHLLITTIFLSIILPFSTLAAEPTSEETSSAKAESEVESQELVILETNENGEIETEDDGIIRIYVDRNERIIQAPTDADGNMITVLKDGNGNYFDREGNPIEIVVVDVIEAETETTTLSLAEQTKWIPAKTNYITKIQMPINELTRFEVFYGAEEDAPILTFTDPRGENKTPIVRTGIDTENYIGLKCTAYYLDPLEEPGTWKIEVKVSEENKNFLLITSEVPEGWELFARDYKTSAISLLKWYFASDSIYSESDIPSIVTSGKVPEINNIEEYSETTEVEEVNRTAFGFIIGILLLIIVTLIVFIVKKQQKEKAKEQKRKDVNDANRKTQERKRMENENLNQFIEQYEDDYKEENVSQNSPIEVSKEEMKQYISSDHITVVDEMALKRIGGYEEKKEQEVTLKTYSEKNVEAEPNDSEPVPSWIQQTQDSSDEEEFF